jgi:predicted nuclease with TOPRIM domain
MALIDEVERTRAERERLRGEIDDYQAELNAYSLENSRQQQVIDTYRDDSNSLQSRITVLEEQLEELNRVQTRSRGGGRRGGRENN